MMVRPIAMATETLTRQIAIRRSPLFAEMRVFTNASRIANSTSGTARVRRSLMTSMPSAPSVSLVRPKRYGRSFPKASPRMIPRITARRTRM
jgi:hypothetical protein